MTSERTQHQQIVLFQWIRCVTNNETNARSVSDLRNDGTTLNKLIEAVTGLKQSTWSLYPKNGKEREQNIKAALDFLRKTGLDTCNLKTKDITCQKLKSQTVSQIIKLLENIFEFHIRSFLEEPDTSDHYDIKELFLGWINDRLLPSLRILNFTDNWCSGKALAALVDSFIPDSFPYWKTWHESQAECEQHLNSAMITAEDKLDIFQWLKPKDICEQKMDAMSNMVYLSQFLVISEIPGGGRSVIRRGLTRRSIVQRSQAPPVYDAPRWDLNTNMIPLGTAYHSSSSSSADSRVESLARSPHQSSLYVPSDQSSVSQYAGQPSTIRTRTASQRSIRSRAVSAPEPDIEEEPQDLRHTAFIRKQGDEECFWNQLPNKEREIWRKKLGIFFLHGDMLIVKKICSGDPSIAYKVRFTHKEHGYQMVTAKTTKEGSSLQDVVNCLREAEIIKNCHHTNILGLIGLTVHQGQLYTLLPYLPLGDLHSHLVNDPDVVTAGFLLNCAVDVAKAMQYLHDECGFVHRNLNAKHCLLAEVQGQKMIKIYDFCYARLSLTGEYVMVSDALLCNEIWRWLPPEVLGPADGLKSAGFKVDVWSYGIFLYEIYSYGKVPYEILGIFHYTDLVEYLNQGETLNRPQAMPDEIYSVVKDCWKLHPGERTTFKSILDFLLKDPKLKTGLKRESQMYCNSPSPGSDEEMYATISEVPIGPHQR